MTKEQNVNEKELKRYVFEADIKGKCSIYVDASSKEEAFQKLKDDWDLLEGSEEWTCELEDWESPESFLNGVEEL